MEQTTGGGETSKETEQVKENKTETKTETNSKKVVDETVEQSIKTYITEITCVGFNSKSGKKYARYTNFDGVKGDIRSPAIDEFPDIHDHDKFEITDFYDNSEKKRVRCKPLKRVSKFDPSLVVKMDKVGQNPFGVPDLILDDISDFDDVKKTYLQGDSCSDRELTRQKEHLWRHEHSWKRLIANGGFYTTNPIHNDEESRVYLNKTTKTITFCFKKKDDVFMVNPEFISEIKSVIELRNQELKTKANTLSVSEGVDKIPEIKTNPKAELLDINSVVTRYSTLIKYAETFTKKITISMSPKLFKNKYMVESILEGDDIFVISFNKKNIVERVAYVPYHSLSVAEKKDVFRLFLSVTKSVNWNDGDDIVFEMKNPVIIFAEIMFAMMNPVTKGRIALVFSGGTNVGKTTLGRLMKKIIMFKDKVTSVSKEPLRALSSALEEPFVVFDEMKYEQYKEMNDLFNQSIGGNEFVGVERIYRGNVEVVNNMNACFTSTSAFSNRGNVSIANRMIELDLNEILKAQEKMDFILGNDDILAKIRGMFYAWIDEYLLECDSDEYRRDDLRTTKRYPEFMKVLWFVCKKLSGYEYKDAKKIYDFYNMKEDVLAIMPDHIRSILTYAIKQQDKKGNVNGDTLQHIVTDFNRECGGGYYWENVRTEINDNCDKNMFYNADDFTLWKFTINKSPKWVFSQKKDFRNCYFFSPVKELVERRRVEDKQMDNRWGKIEEREFGESDVKMVFPSNDAKEDVVEVKDDVVESDDVVDAIDITENEEMLFAEIKKKLPDYCDLKKNKYTKENIRLLLKENNNMILMFGFKISDMEMIVERFFKADYHNRNEGGDET